MSEFERLQQWTRARKLANEMTHRPFTDPYSGVAENFAVGVREAPGMMMEAFDALKATSPMAWVVESFNPPSQTSADVMNELMGLAEVEQAFQELGPYDATPSLQAMARLSGQMIDPLAVAGAAPDALRYGARVIQQNSPQALADLAEQAARSGVWDQGDAAVRQMGMNAVDALNQGMVGRAPWDAQRGSVGVDSSLLPMDEASRLRRAEEMGMDTEVFHGSTHDITEFRGDIANPESDWGAATYTSTSIDDVNPNYAGEGPDLTGRIEREAERVADDLMDDYYRSEILEEFDIPESRYEADEAGVALEIARNRLKGGSEGAVYPLRVNTEKYAVIGGPDSTKLTDNDYFDLARSELDPTDYADEVDFEDAVLERAYEIRNEDPDSLINRVYDALRDTDGYQDEMAISSVIEEIQDGLTDGVIDIDDLDQAVRSNFNYVIDDNGDMISPGGISAQVLKNLGFEGVIDNQVNLKFGDGRARFGTSMPGVRSDTAHIVTFPGYEKNLRSQFAKFDPAQKASSNILAGAGGLGLLGMIQQYSQPKGSDEY